MGKRVITEADVARMEAPGELVVTPDVVVTPAALDTAFAKGLRVIYQRASTPAFQGGLNDREKRLLKKLSALSEGDYLLQVRAGRLRLFEIRDDGISPVPGT